MIATAAATPRATGQIVELACNRAKPLESRLASVVKIESFMTRLDNIATRQRRNRLRDAAFATLVLLAGVASIASVSTAVHAANVAHVAKR